MSLVHVEDLVGCAEASEILHLTDARIGQLRRANQFPEPVWQVRATPLWLRSDLLDWQENRVMGKPGRRRRTY